MRSRTEPRRRCRSRSTRRAASSEARRREARRRLSARAHDGRPAPPRAGARPSAAAAARRRVPGRAPHRPAAPRQPQHRAARAGHLARDRSRSRRGRARPARAPRLDVRAEEAGRRPVEAPARHRARALGSPASLPALEGVIADLRSPLHLRDVARVAIARIDRRARKRDAAQRCSRRSSRPCSIAATDPRSHAPSRSCSTRTSRRRARPRSPSTC